MNTSRIPATSGVVLVLLAAGSMAGAGVFAAPAREDRGSPVVERQLEVGRFADIKLRGAWKLQWC